MKKVNGLYCSFNDSRFQQHPSSNIVIKEIKINLDNITVGKNLLSSFARQLSAKLSQEFENNIKEDFKEQHSLNSQLYIEKTCNDLKDFLLDGCIENKKSYEQLVKNYDSILNIYHSHNIKHNKIESSSFNLKDFLSLCFSLPNTYRRFIRLFPKNIVEKTIMFLFKNDSQIFYRIADEVAKIISSFEKKKQKNDFTGIKITDILANVDKSTVDSLESLRLNEDLKEEIYASIFEHYERFGYIKRSSFLDSLLDIINVKDNNGFNLARENDNILIVKENENENKEISYEEKIKTNSRLTNSPITEIYDNISHARNGDSVNLLSFFEKNKDNFKNKILYCNTQEILPLISEIDFNDLDISPLLYFTNEEMVDTYALLRKVFKGREKDVNKCTLKFLCSDDTNNNTNTFNINDTKKTYFHSLFKTLGGVKDDIKMLKDYGEGELLSTLISADIQQKEIDIENNKGKYIHNRTVERIDNRRIEAIQNNKEINSQNNKLLEERNDSTAEKKEYNKDKETLGLCANIIARFFSNKGIPLQKVHIEPIEDNNIFFSFISTSVINYFLQLKKGLHILSSFYDFLKDNESPLQNCDLTLLNKLTEEIYSFIMVIHSEGTYFKNETIPEENISKKTFIHDEKSYPKTESTDSGQDITDTNSSDAFLGLKVNVAQLSFKVYNKFMFTLGDDQQRLKNTFFHIYSFLNNINKTHIIDTSILLLKNVKKDNITLLDKCLSDILKEEMFHDSSPINIGTLKIKNKNNLHLFKNFKTFLDNISKNNLVEEDTTYNPESKGIKHNDILITEEDIIIFIKDPYTPCSFSKALHLSLKKEDAHIINKAISIVSGLDTKKQSIFFKAIYDTFSHQEYSKIADTIIIEGRASQASTYLYDFIKNKSKNEGEKNLFLPVLLYVLKDKKAQEEEYNNLQNTLWKQDNNDSSITSFLNRLKNNSSYSRLCRDSLSIFYKDYEYNDSQLTHFITKECNPYNNKSIDINAAKDNITSLYLHKIIELLNIFIGHEEITTETNILKDVNILEKKLFTKDNDESNVNEKKDYNNENDNLKNNDTEKTSDNDESKENEYKPELVKEIYIHNGGLIFLYPFFVDYLTKLSLWDVEKQEFVDKYSQDNAIHSLQYIINSKADNVEWHVILNKLLCGEEYNENISSGYIFDEDKEKRKQQINILKKTSIEVIKKCINEWRELQKLKRFKDFAKGITVKNFKEYVLKRTAMIKVYNMINSTDSFLTYIIELSTKSYDEEIATIPWVIDKIQLPWMKKPIYITNLIIKHKNK